MQGIVFAGKSMHSNVTALRSTEDLFQSLEYRQLVSLICSTTLMNNSGIFVFNTPHLFLRKWVQHYSENTLYPLELSSKSNLKDYSLKSPIELSRLFVFFLVIWF